jgi:hypothetical protein
MEGSFEDLLEDGKPATAMGLSEEIAEASMEGSSDASSSLSSHIFQSSEMYFSFLGATGRTSLGIF